LGLTRIEPPLDYLRTASRSLLQSFELSRLNNAANIRREIAALVDQWIEEAAQAMMARWMMEHYSSLHVPLRSVAEGSPTAQHMDAFPLPDIGPVPTEAGPAPPRYAEPRKSLSGEGEGRREKSPARVAR